MDYFSFVGALIIGIFGAFVVAVAIALADRGGR